MDDSSAITAREAHKRRRPRRVDFLLITANDHEAKAVADVFELVNDGPSEKGIAYKWGYLTSKNDNQQLIVVHVEQKDRLGKQEAGELATQMALLLHPSVVILVGITAGVRTDEVDAQPGDVIYSAFVHTGPKGKDANLRTEPSYPPSLLLNREAEQIESGGSWRECLNLKKWSEALAQSKLAKDTRMPKATSGEFVSADGFVHPYDDFVISSLQRYPKLAAFDMEAGGVATSFLKLADSNQAPAYIVIKAVSDMVYDKNKATAVLHGLDSNPAITKSKLKKANVAQRKKWKPFASHAAAVFVKELIQRSTAILNRPCHPDVFWPIDQRTSAYVNTGCIAVYASVEPITYSRLAADLLTDVSNCAACRSDKDFEHFFTVCAFSPSALWDVIVAVACRHNENPTSAREVYAASKKYFPHFETFATHVRENPDSGVRILLLNDWVNWNRKRATGDDAVPSTFMDHWKLFLLLSGYEEDGSGSGVPFWGIDRKAIRSHIDAERGFRFLTDYVIFGGEVLLDYYDESGILVASEVERNARKSYFTDLRELFVGENRGGPFKSHTILHEQVTKECEQEARQVGASL